MNYKVFIYLEQHREVIRDLWNWNSWWALEDLSPLWMKGWWSQTVVGLQSSTAFITLFVASSLFVVFVWFVRCEPNKYLNINMHKWRRCVTCSQGMTMGRRIAHMYEWLNMCIFHKTWLNALYINTYTSIYSMHLAKYLTISLLLNYIIRVTVSHHVLCKNDFC